MQRRQVLLGSSAILTGSAGCVADKGEISGGTETSTTNKETATDENRSVIEAHATVETQPSENNPAIVNLGLKNIGSATATVLPRSRNGQPLEWLGKPLQGETGEAVFHPIGTHGVTIIEGDLPTERKHGCWRLETSENAEVQIAIVSMKIEVELEPDETHSVNHQIYYTGPEGVCFPADEYRTQVGIEIVSEGGDRSEILYDLTLIADNEFQASLDQITENNK